MFPLSSEDIYNFIIKDDLMFKALGGIYPSDKLPKKRLQHKFYFINSDPAILPGTHWMCVFTPPKSYPEFFDSLGKEPNFYSDDISSFIGKEYLYNFKPIQPNNTDTCGMYCLFFLYHRVRGFSYKDIVHVFNEDLRYNDGVVIDFYIDFECG